MAPLFNVYIPLPGLNYASARKLIQKAPISSALAFQHQTPAQAIQNMCDKEDLLAGVGWKPG